MAEGSPTEGMQVDGAEWARRMSKKTRTEEAKKARIQRLQEEMEGAARTIPSELYTIDVPELVADG